MSNAKKFLLIAAIITTGFLWASPAADKDETQDAIMRHLREIEIAAAQIQDHAAELGMLSRKAYMGAPSHAFELGLISDRVEDIGETVPKLQALSEKTDWQTDVVDRISAYSAAMASETDAAIQYAKEHRSQVELMRDTYQKRLDGIYQFAEYIDDLVDYAKTRQNLEHFSEKLTR